MCILRSSILRRRWYLYMIHIYADTCMLRPSAWHPVKLTTAFVTGSLCECLVQWKLKSNRMTRAGICAAHLVEGDSVDLDHGHSKACLTMCKHLLCIRCDITDVQGMHTDIMSHSKAYQPLNDSVSWTPSPDLSKLVSVQPRKGSCHQHCNC